MGEGIHTTSQAADHGQAAPGGEFGKAAGLLAAVDAATTCADDGEGDCIGRAQLTFHIQHDRRIGDLAQAVRIVLIRLTDDSRAQFCCGTDFTLDIDALASAGDLVGLARPNAGNLFELRRRRPPGGLR
jgi:hypothetical protein